METNRKIPYRAVHPYEIVKEELKARNISQKEFASRMGMQPSNLCRLLKSEAPITVDIAKRLESALGIPSSTWINMQLSYEEDVKNITERDNKERTAITIENMLSSIMNIKLFFHRLNIRPTLFIQEKLKYVQDIIGIPAQDIPQLNICFSGNYKKSDKYTENEQNETTWRLLAYISAKQNKPQTAYKENNAETAAKELVTAVHGGNIKEADIKQILNNNGISYSIVEKLEKTHIDGFSAWIEGVPSIVTTHRYNDIARLVFTILHELGHIQLHLKNGDQRSFTTTDETYSCSNKEEIEANHFAEEHLISKHTWNAMMREESRLGSKNIANTLKKLSDDNHLNYGIVCWRYKYEYNKYALRGMPVTHIQ